MRLFLLRHAIAEPRDPQRFPDDARRPLTPEGTRRMRRAVRGMKALGLRFDAVLSSPLARARQTARLVVDGYGRALPLRVLKPLGPGGGSGGVFAALASFDAMACVLLVGHEPDLTQLVGALVLEVRGDLPMEFKKGGLCRIDSEGVPRPGSGRLIFHLPPKVLRGLASRPRAQIG